MLSRFFSNKVRRSKCYLANPEVSYGQEKSNDNLELKKLRSVYLRDTVLLGKRYGSLGEEIWFFWGRDTVFF